MITKKALRDLQDWQEWLSTELRNDGFLVPQPIEFPCVGIYIGNFPYDPTIVYVYKTDFMP